MQFKGNVVILGMKRSKGEFEGRAFSSTRIFVEDTLGEDKADVRGTSIAVYKIGDAAEFEKYAALPFPIRAEATFGTEADGKGGTRVVIQGISPIRAPKAA